MNRNYGAVKQKKNLTNVEFITGLMEFSKYGPLAQIFVIDALDKFSKKISESKPSDYPEDSFINPESWIGVANEIKEKLEKRNQK